MSKEWRVALLIETARGYGRQVLRGIVDYANRNGHWSFYITPGDFDQALPEMTKWGGTGIIARILTPRQARAIRDTGLPAIALDLPAARGTAGGESYHGFSELVTDSLQAARMAARYLLGKGFRYYGFVGIPGMVWSDRREKGFCEAIVAAGFAAEVFRDAPENKGRGTWGLQQKSLARWLRALPKPIGLMACNDDRGREVLEACWEARLRVPEEVAVLGVDNDSLLCDLSNPPLSSVVLNAERGGFQAAALLHEMMSGQVRTPQQISVEPLYVVSRRSTDIVALEDVEAAAAMRFIRDHADQPIRVNQVAHAIGLSRRMLEIRFRQLLGRSLNDEIQQCHLETAKRLLAETDWPMGKIAAASGYSSASYLNVLFRRLLGVSPTEFRKRTRTR